MPSRFRSRAAWLLLLSAAAFLGLSGPALAAETGNSEIVIIQPDDVVHDDLYAAAIRVVVSGVIDGDLIALAVDEVLIEGEVTGSVFAVAPTVTITGTVGESLRVNANTLRVEGEIGGDIVTAALRVDLTADSVVGGEVLAWAYDMSAVGSIGENLEGSQRSLDLAGSVGGDVNVSGGRLAVVGPLTVDGDLGYRSAAEADGLDQATVGGAIVHKTPLPPNIRVRALGFLGRFLVILLLTMGAVAIGWVWPERTRAAINSASGSTVRSWGWGAVVMFSPFLVAAVIALIVALAPPAASLPLLVILAPVVLAMLGLVFALAVVAGVPAVGWLGRVLFRRLDVHGSLLAGSLLAGLVWLIPVIGWLVPLVVLPLGMGAWLVSWRRPQPE